MTEFNELLDKLLDVRNLQCRCSGRTFTLINGVRNCDNAVLVVLSNSQLATIKRKYPDVDVVSIHNIDKLYGANKVIILDNSVVDYLIDLCYYMNNKLKNMQGE